MSRSNQQNETRLQEFKCGGVNMVPSGPFQVSEELCLRME